MDHHDEESSTREYAGVGERVHKGLPLEAATHSPDKHSKESGCHQVRVGQGVPVVPPGAGGDAGVTGGETRWCRDKAGAGVPSEGAPGNRCTVSLGTPRAFAPPPVPPVPPGERVNRRSLPQAACSRPTADFVQHGVDRRRLNAELAQARKLGGRDVVVLHQSDLVACKGSSRHITGPENKHMGGAGAEVSFCREKSFAPGPHDALCRTVRATSSRSTLRMAICKIGASFYAKEADTYLHDVGFLLV
jgi:hypothetical protein